MGLSTKEVSGDWDQAPPQTEAVELSKPTRQQPEIEALKCPRCDSTNTKFCYYNNYNKSQPRYFCKSCKRHWTKGGTLRNVPVGGGRKNKRAKISNPAPSTTVAADPTNTVQHNNQNTDFSCDQKTMSSFLYQALLQRTPMMNGEQVEKEKKEFTWFNNAGNLFMAPQENIPNTEFPFSSLSNSLELNSSLMPSSYQSLNVYGNILDSVEESTITTVNIPTTSATPWPGSGPSTMDLTNYWNWNEIDTLTSADHLWDEDGDDSAEIKP